MSMYNPPVNSQYRIAASWLFMVCLVTFIPFIIIFTNLNNAEFPYFYVIQSHDMPGFIVLSSFYSLFCGLFFWVYISRAALFDNTIKEKFLASWILEGKDWDSFKDSETSQEITSSGKLVLIIAFVLIVMALIMVAIKPIRNTALFLGVIFGIAIFLVLFVFIRNYFYSQNLKYNYGLIYLNEKVLIYNSFIHQFKGIGSRLDNMEIIEDNGNAALGIIYSYSTRSGRITRTVFVPIPISEKEKFKELAEYIKIKKFKPKTVFNKIDLIGNKVNLSEIKPFANKIISAILLSCCISFIGAYVLVNKNLNEHKKMLKEQKIKEETLKKRVIDYNSELYAQLPESAGNFKKSQSYIWDYTYLSENTEFVMSEILDDCSLILGNEKFDGTTEIRKIDNNGKEIWKKSYSRVFGNLTFFSNEILKLKNNLCFISLYPEYDGVLLKLHYIDSLGNSKGIIDVKIDSVGSLKYPEIFKRDDESFIYHAISEDDGMNFIAIINHDGKILNKRKIGDIAERDGTFYGWGDAANLFKIESDLIQAYKNKINIFDLDGNLSKSLKINDSAPLELKNPFYDLKENILFFNSFHEIYLPDKNKTENNYFRKSLAFINQYFDSLNIVKINKISANKNEINLSLRKFKDLRVNFIKDNKFLILATTQIDISEYKKILIGIYDEENNSLKEEIIGIENFNLDLIKVVKHESDIFIIAGKNKKKFDTSKELVVIKMKF